MDPTAIDQLRLNFNPQSLLALNAVIGLMMFWMGFGSLIQSRVPKAWLIRAFIFIEIALALAGGFSPSIPSLRL